VKDCPEDFANVRYLQLCALEAGIDTYFIFTEDIGFDEEGDWFDLDNNLIENLFKLYPWEDLMAEDLQLEKPSIARLILDEQMTFLEPIWKAILSNKGILPIFWQLFKNHQVYGQYLLEAYNDASYCPEIEYLMLKPYVKKPLFGREGQNIQIIDPEQKIPLGQRQGEYGEEGYIIQDYMQLLQNQGFSIIMGSWIVGDEPCGMSLRGDRTLITGDTALFIPHIIR
jgi:glutathionylspermidine synthase